ncbi:MAG: hypothetical protein WC755_07500, partial [Candidatus Woesearchaeota archaeon]
SEFRITISPQTKIAFSDVWPFMREGIPVIRMLSRGGVSKTIMHTSDDTFEKLDIKTLTYATDIAKIIIENLEF